MPKKVPAQFKENFYSISIFSFLCFWHVTVTKLWHEIFCPKRHDFTVFKILNDTSWTSQNHLRTLDSIKVCQDKSFQSLVTVTGTRQKRKKHCKKSKRVMIQRLFILEEPPFNNKNYFLNVDICYFFKMLHFGL